MHRCCTAIVALVTAATAAAADPHTLRFRVVRWSAESPRPHELISYALSSAGGQATLDVTYAQEAPVAAGGSSWTVERTESFAGTARMIDGTTVLELASDAHVVRYRCQTRTLPVAGAGTVREMIPGHERPSNGRWPQGTTTRVPVQLCTLVQEVQGANLPRAERELDFAPRGLEHVIADDNCCGRPGDSLRWIPADGSVTPGR